MCLEWGVITGKIKWKKGGNWGLIENGGLKIENG